jgi:hypothetical protein
VLLFITYVIVSHFLVKRVMKCNFHELVFRLVLVQFDKYDSDRTATSGGAPVELGFNLLIIDRYI